MGFSYFTGMHQNFRYLPCKHAIAYIAPILYRPYVYEVIAEKVRPGRANPTSLQLAPKMQTAGLCAGRIPA